MDKLMLSVLDGLLRSGMSGASFSVLVLVCSAAPTAVRNALRRLQSRGAVRVAGRGRSARWYLGSVALDIATDRDSLEAQSDAYQAFESGGFGLIGNAFGTFDDCACVKTCRCSVDPLTKVKGFSTDGEASGFRSSQGSDAWELDEIESETAVEKAETRLHWAAVKLNRATARHGTGYMPGYLKAAEAYDRAETSRTDAEARYASATEATTRWGSTATGLVNTTDLCPAYWDSIADAHVAENAAEIAIRDAAKSGVPAPGPLNGEMEHASAQRERVAASIAHELDKLRAMYSLARKRGQRERMASLEFEAKRYKARHRAKYASVVRDIAKGLDPYRWGRFLYLTKEQVETLLK